MAEPRELLTYAETAARLRCSENYVRDLRAKGLIRSVTVGTGPRPRVYFRPEHIAEYLASITVTEVGPLEAS